MLRLNTDEITVSETQLNALEERFKNETSENDNHEEIAVRKDILSYEELHQCIEVIKKKQEKYYTISESAFFRNPDFHKTTKQQSYLIALLRDISTAEYHNKLSRDGEEIFRTLIDADSYQFDNIF